MDVAFSTPDQRTFTAMEFSNLPATRLEELRTQLTCTECGNPAFFRKRTRDGRAPCSEGALTETIALMPPLELVLGVRRAPTTKMSESTEATELFLI
jgi:hypothetical protein